MIDEAVVNVLSDPEAVAQTAASRVARVASEAVRARGRCTVALSGGSTPKRLYQLLAGEPFRAQVPWLGCHLFWGDERCVPPDDPSSNFRLADEALIRHVPLPASNVHRIEGEREPQSAAQAYHQVLLEFFCGPRPRFDLMLLGLGLDGHTASLFPGSEALQEAKRLALAVQAGYRNRPVQRVTLTLPAINTARHILFLVTGADKAEIVHQVLRDPSAALPAQCVRPTAGHLAWLLDRAAASLLEGEA
jgi:6-phosphogluconolactonase